MLPDDTGVAPLLWVLDYCLVIGQVIRSRPGWVGTSYRIQDLRPCPFKNPQSLSEIFSLFEHEKQQSNMTINSWLSSPVGCDSFTIHHSDVIMGATASQTTSLMIVYSTVYSDTDQRKHQSSASLAFVQGIHRWLVNSRHKWPVTRKMFSFNDVIMPLEAMTVLKFIDSSSGRKIM